MIIGIDPMAILAVNLLLVLDATESSTGWVSLYWLFCGSSDTAQGINIPTIKVVNIENPLVDSSSKRIIIDTDTIVIDKNMIEENSRNVTTAKTYPIILKIQMINEKEA